MSSFAIEKPYNKQDFIGYLDNTLFSDFQLDEHKVELENVSCFSAMNHLGISHMCGVSAFEVICSEKDSKKRIAITQNAFRVLRKYGISNAIIAFIDGTSRWRLSLLTSKLELKDGKVISQPSNPRRYSYLLGEGTKTHTPFKFLIDKGFASSLEDILGRFSVEVVNKQFYDEIARHFSQLVGGERGGIKYQGLLNIYGINRPSVKYQEFAVRLIGRIMFCWFLKEKRSAEGIALIPDNMLSKKAIEENKGYYHNILEPLFFELLNTKAKRRKGIFKSEEYTHIPYLNGGLFSPQHDDFYRFSDALNGGVPGIITIPDEWFISLFEVLERYNFTVDENTTYDVELSIDPEMLGRIFENLLAEINPSTGESIKKSTGSFYTPRDIVDYMVDTSLIHYLKQKTDISEKKLSLLISYGQDNEHEFSLTKEDRIKIVDALSTLTILDPACGSGAFPIGILQKIVYILQQIDENSKLWVAKQYSSVTSTELLQEIKDKQERGMFDYIRKLGVIRESIFGIDIQTIATEIAKLRCFLSLIVEEIVEDSEPNRGIWPLPNLDFKFISANSLVRLEDKSEAEGQISLFEDVEHIDELKRIRDMYFIADADERVELREEFTKIQKEMLLKTIQNHKTASNRYQLLYSWNPFENESTSWFDPEWMFGNKKFDIIIANPPYGLINKKQNQSTSISVTESELTYYKDNPIYQPAKGGMLNIYRLFVCLSHHLLRDGGNFSLIFPMAYMCDLSAANLREFIFKNARTLYIEAFPERDNEKKRVFEAVKMSVCILGIEKSIPKLDDSFMMRINTDRYVDTEIEPTIMPLDRIKQIDPKGLTVPISSQPEFDLFIKITDNTQRLGEVTKCYTGEIDLSLDKKYVVLHKTNGILIRGAQVQKYRITNEISQGDILYLLKDNYLINNTASRSQHHKQKRIIMQGITGINEKVRLKMTLCDEGVFCANSVNYIIPSDSFSTPEYLLGILNSKLINWFFSKLSTNSNVNGYEVDNLPIKKSKNPHDIHSKVSQILDIKQSDPNADTSTLEMEIDSMVYELYGLTDYEIKIIEKCVL